MLVTLRKIVQGVSAATHLDDVLDIIVHRVEEAQSIDACAVYLTDVESHYYVLMAADGFHTPSIGEVRIDRQEGLLGLVGERRELITVSDAAAHSTIGHRVLLQLQTEAEETRQYPQQCVLVGDTVSIVEISAVPVGQLAGIVCMPGSALSHTAVMARALGIPAVVSVCGELAGDPAGALLLLGMGVDALSMSATSLAHIKLVIRSFSPQRARSLLDEALLMEDGFAVHRLLSGALEEVGV